GAPDSGRRMPMRGTLIERPLTVVVLSAFLACSTVGVAAPAAPLGGAFAGRITYQNSGSVLHGAVLEASHLGSHTVYTSAETSELGRYNLQDLPSGTYDLTVRTDRGIYAAESLVSLAPGESKTLNFAVRPAPMNRRLVETPEPEGAAAAAKK